MSKKNSRFRPELYKFFDHIERSTHPCQKCSKVTGFRMPGDVFVQNVNSVMSIDGEKAYRVYFVCERCKNINFVGYTKPVDFEKNLGKYEVGDDLPDYDASEEVWEDWAREQQRQDLGNNPKVPGSGLILTI